MLGKRVLGYLKSKHSQSFKSHSYILLALFLQKKTKKIYEKQR